MLSGIAKELLIPDQYLTNVWDIDLEKFQSDGVENIIFDLDNTLLASEQRIISLQHANWVQKCKDFGFKVFLLSNNRSKKRVKRSANQLKCHSIYLAMKPFTFSAVQMAADFNINLEKSVMIGDQVFKDVVMGNWMRMHTVLVDPLDKKLSLFSQLQKDFEQFLIKKFSDD